MKITIFGLAWSWTSTIWKLLSKELKHEFMSSWNIIRAWADDLWYTLYEFEDKVMKKDNSFDIKLDSLVEKYWKENNDFIFESRLAWNFIPDSFKIYLKCEEEERYRRIHSREWWDISEIINKNKKREEELIERYKNFYPEIIFPPKEEKFDFIINSTNLEKEQVIEKILNRLNS